MKLIKLLANLGYGSRKEVQAMIRSGWVKDAHGQVIKDGAAVTHEEVRFREEPIDPPAPLTIILNKPDGFTCSTEDPGETIYDLLPERFAHRKPGLNSIGRLDKDTTGLLLMTDDGKLLHRIIHPKHGCLKVYHATLDRRRARCARAAHAAGPMPSPRAPPAPAVRREGAGRARRRPPPR